MDRQQDTENYGRAISFVLGGERITTLEPRGNYFVHIPGLGNSQPVIHGILYYFIYEKHARGFAERFCPNGLIARMEE